VIKEEKNQGFKKQNYYYKNKNFRRNSFSSFSHSFDSSTFQLAQAFPMGEGITGKFPPIPKQVPAYIPRKLTWKRKQMWLPWKQKILGRIQLQRGEEKIFRRGRLSILQKGGN
jgi:hypothetical protein